MADKSAPNAIETETIANFGGRLTRKLNGKLDSGLAKFNTSWGYDPFSKPDNLTWFEQPTSILSSTTNCILDGKPRLESGTQYVYAVGAGVSTNGTLYKIQTNNVSATPNALTDTPSVIGALATNSPRFSYGASMEFFGDTEKIYVGHNIGINSINFDGSGDAQVGAGGYKTNEFRALEEFIGKLMFANGNTVGAVASTGTVTSSIIGTGQGNLYSELNPSLGVETHVRDVDLSPDGNYLYVTGSEISNEEILNSNSDTPDAAAASGAIFYWNGTDVTATAKKTIPSYLVSALQTFLSENLFFSNDAFGAAVNDGDQKLLTLINNKSPLPNATAVNGTFLTWAVPEITSTGTQVASLYYFGSLDAESERGLYRIMRIATTQSGGYIYQVPFNALVNNKYSTFSLNKTSLQVMGYGKHYISVFDQNSSTDLYKLYRFLVTSTGSGTPQSGVYETQTQLWSNRITVKAIRVYTEPTATGNGFQIDCIGSDGSVITNGSFTYTYAAGTDPTLLQGALERIDFKPQMKDTYALGLRVTNTGTTNMTIKKIEVDWTYSGK